MCPCVAYALLRLRVWFELKLVYGVVRQCFEIRVFPVLSIIRINVYVRIVIYERFELVDIDSTYNANVNCCYSSCSYIQPTVGLVEIKLSQFK